MNYIKSKLKVLIVNLIKILVQRIWTQIIPFTSVN